MDKTKGHEPISAPPDWAVNQKVRSSEWDSDNNRIYNLSRTYKRSFNKLLENQPDVNRRICTDFFKRMRFEGISQVRQINYMRALQRLQRTTGDLPLKELDKTHIDAYLTGIADASAGTKQILFYCLKKFLVFLGKEELLKGVKPAATKDIKVKASDLLTREDLQKLLEAAPTARGRAFIMTLYESGARIGELLNLERKEIEFDSDGALMDLDGKTGRRRIRLVESAQLLQKWFDEIAKENPTARYVWFGADGQPSQYRACAKFVVVTAKRAGLRKKVYPHLFRHSRASELAQKLKESQLRAFMGWGADSKMPRVYIHLSAQDVDRAIPDLYKPERAQSNIPAGDLSEFMRLYEMFKRTKALG